MIKSNERIFRRNNQQSGTNFCSESVFQKSTKKFDFDVSVPTANGNIANGAANKDALPDLSKSISAKQMYLSKSRYIPGGEQRT